MKHREPIFAPGGLWTLAYVATSFAAMYAFTVALDAVFTALGL